MLPFLRPHEAVWCPTHSCLKASLLVLSVFLFLLLQEEYIQGVGGWWPLRHGSWEAVWPPAMMSPISRDWCPFHPLLWQVIEAIYETHTLIYITTQTLLHTCARTMKWAPEISFNERDLFVMIREMGLEIELRMSFQFKKLIQKCDLEFFLFFNFPMHHRIFSMK